MMRFSFEKRGFIGRISFEKCIFAEKTEMSADGMGDAHPSYDGQRETQSCGFRSVKPGNESLDASLEEQRNIFAASCVETLALRLGVSTRDAYSRMEQVGMMEKFVYPFYDTLHTESREHVTEDLLECLLLWEKGKS